MKWTKRAQFLVECLDLEEASGVEGAKWEGFQLALLNDDATFRIENKSRQIAWSWSIAAEAVAEAVLEGQSSAFVSINLDEAMEKIRYALAIFTNLQGVKLPALVRNNRLGVEFANGARILSLPARPPRGKARLNIYLDEFAHVQYDKSIYTAALPIISKGGRLRIGSSPMGAGGVFWEVFSEKLRPYPGYNRRTTPWWEVFAFCTNVREARRIAPTLTTSERVERYGTPRIVTLYENMPHEDFAQEYECDFVDEATAWITWDEIKANEDPGLRCFLATGRGAALDKVLALIDEVARAVEAGEIEASLAAGMDVGRTRNTSEIYLVGKPTTNSFPLRVAITLDAVDFDGQADVLGKVLSVLPVSQMMIDRTGLGRQLAETFEKRYPVKVRGVDFTAGAKELWATNAKMLFQQKRCPIPVNRDLGYQIHSIKKLVTPSKNVSFDTDSNEKHHADKFWALALALSVASKRPLKEVKSYQG